MGNQGSTAYSDALMRAEGSDDLVPPRAMSSSSSSSGAAGAAGAAGGGGGGGGGGGEGGRYGHGGGYGEGGHDMASSVEGDAAMHGSDTVGMGNASAVPVNNVNGNNNNSNNNNNNNNNNVALAGDGQHAAARSPWDVQTRLVTGSGLYFGGHYVPGRGMAQPSARETGPRPHVQETVSIDAGVYINKESLAVSEDSTSGLYTLSFDFDAAVEGTMEVYLAASEELAGNSPLPVIVHAVVGSVAARPAPTPVAFGPGLGQSFELPTTDGLDLAAYEELAPVADADGAGDVDDHAAADADVETGDSPAIVSVLAQLPESASSSQSDDARPRIFPLVVVVRTSGGADAVPAGGTGEAESLPVPAAPQVQILYASLRRSSSGAYSVRTLRQKLVVGNDEVYLLQDVFGLDAEEEDGTTECVVCMSDPRDTLVLPCRHMCLCGECAEELRVRSSRCPICRTHFTSLLSISDPSKPAAASDGSEAEPDNGGDDGGDDSLASDDDLLAAAPVSDTDGEAGQPLIELS
ncbi:uncharacterized protein AMSG_10489 [Thecamonas trahens ATCC 50062]|uniref:RING-type E3 ubiquitin transferase n=1 Tax=Thecamonas trahens ATCC 50062 TaxID=461836 RepID=A0A0L0DR49_THETB|nr:hypothetical protein AMSG_10489 [Thecamonas trahens ATCC 50062]KNC54491.1 hypothetical protein AMSG_10489 [Thecamonas trahens ATCC 50062]|eukprot:XP_013753644.1 hypothetical protein AMSG_10489 [Thecamonas trahens ATCC 50062]